jgi:hypothetical protein
MGIIKGSFDYKKPTVQLGIRTGGAMELVYKR